MPAEPHMTVDGRRTYLRRMQPSYLKASKRERGEMLSHMEVATELDRKTLIRLLQTDLERHPRQTKRRRTYGPDVDDALRIITESWDYPCAERLTPDLAWMASHLAKHGELNITPQLIQQLSTISIPTVRRILTRIHQDVPRLPRPRPSGPNAALRAVPMQVIPWDTSEPGHFEADLVHHCGMETDRQDMHTVQLIDIATGWSERVATLGRSYSRMQEAFSRILARVPFPILELHPDNGSEFFNTYLLAFWRKEVANAKLTRSRPFHKNDNRFVEQRNSSEVRAYFGTHRLDTASQVWCANRIYEKLWVYYNLFQPILRLVEKTTIPAEGGGFSTKLRHDTAKTPFERLCATGVLIPEKRIALERQRDQINPRHLRQEIYDLLERTLALPCADACADEATAQKGGTAQ
jgi:hypothetical protein